MALLSILEFPDPRLRTVAKPVAQVDARIQQLVTDLYETMYDADGIGLAATQVNVHERVLVLDVSEERNQPMALINPELTLIGEPILWNEGCLSVPTFYEEVERIDRIAVSALNEQGEPIQFEADGLLAICIQHECDHLAGKLFVDHISNLKRSRIRQKMEKLHKAQKKA